MAQSKSAVCETGMGMNLALHGFDQFDVTVLGFLKVLLMTFYVELAM